MNYEYQWRYCGMLEIDILGILENGGCDWAVFLSYFF
jgi:hypothetical protein